jgi:hypothetical protein
MWSPISRQQYSRTVTRYQTDLTDAEWRVIAPHLPMPCAKGRPRVWPLREILNTIFYVMRGGITGRLLPSDFPPWNTHVPLREDQPRLGHGRSGTRRPRGQPLCSDGRGLLIEPRFYPFITVGRQHVRIARDNSSDSHFAGSDDRGGIHRRLIWTLAVQ